MAKKDNRAVLADPGAVNYCDLDLPMTSLKDRIPLLVVESIFVVIRVLNLVKLYVVYHICSVILSVSASTNHFVLVEFMHASILISAHSVTSQIAEC